MNMHFSPLPFIRKYLRKRLGNRVYDGPYRGMVFPENTGIDCFESKLMGIYEKELHSVISTITKKKLQSLVVIGAAEGYHAVGLARITNLNPYCFEGKQHSRRDLEKLAASNQLDINIHEEFIASTELKLPDGLIFMDIEGDEERILSLQRLKEWEDHHLIIEIHSKPILETLSDRANDFFNTKWIKCHNRTVKDYPFKVPLKRILQRWWNVPVQEWRSDSLGWLILTPLS